MQSMTDVATMEERYGATLGKVVDQNMMAALIAMAFLAAIYLFARDKNISWRVIYLIAIGFLPIMVIRTGSRSCSIALVFTLVSPLLFIRQVWRRPTLIILLLQISHPVIYQNSPPILATKQEWAKSITGQKPLNYDEPQFWEPYIITKTTDWEYQKEWRVVDFCDKGETGLFSDYGFDPRELRSVYLGCNISEEVETDITSLLKFDLAHVKVFRGKKLERERRLSFERIKP
jgi:hypothetical protein